MATLNRVRERSDIITNAVAKCWEAEEAVERVQGAFWTTLGESTKDRDEPRHKRATELWERQKTIRRDLSELFHEVAQDTYS